MSSDLYHNLSFSVNLPKPTVHSEEVMTAVNETLTKYYYKAHYEDYLNYYNLHKHLFEVEKASAVMLSEKIILCEINACLWIKALNSAISSISRNTYPHYVIVQKVINYLFNTSSEENFGVVEDFLNKLLISHPPNSDMSDYYWQIMSEHFVAFSEDKTEEEALIFCLIETITSCLKTWMSSDEGGDQNPLLTESEFLYSSKISSRDSELTNLEAVENFNILNKSPTEKGNKKQIYFIDIPIRERIKRCLLVFNFVYDILETDFIFWLQSKELKPSFSDTQPLMSRLLWSNVRDIGLLNKEVHKILDLYKLVNSSNFGFRIKRLTEKLVTLLGEVFRCSDNSEQVKYPFLGTKSDNFFRELSVISYQNLVDSKKIPSENELIVNFKPPWLRLFLCSRLLSLITGYQCLPELTGVYDILEHIAHTENRSQRSTKAPEKSEIASNSRLMKKMKFKSVNTKLRNGKTLLHVACEDNNVEEIKALLSFPELDVNAVDRNGWTALHAAALKGNTDSVRELLSFSPKSEDAQKAVNTRAQGQDDMTPLMCAVLQGHAKVCQLLLEHSGSVLLEDVNEPNQTALELSSVQEVTDILQYYKKNKVWTLHSHKDINFDPDLKGIVLRLCVEMVQAYFCTYRTWDVYKTLKRSGKKSGRNLTASDLDFKWDYMRYHRDIKRNIYQLRRLIPKLEHVEEFKGLNEIYARMLSFNKTC